MWGPRHGGVIERRRNSSRSVQLTHSLFPARRQIALRRLSPSFSSPKSPDRLLLDPSSPSSSSTAAVATPMSFVGAHGGSAARQHYYCHQCDRTVALVPNAAEISCPICHGGFLEEVEPPNPNPNPNPFFPFAPSSDAFFLSPSLPFFLSSSSSSSPAATSFDLRNPGDLAGLLGPDLVVTRSGPVAPSAAHGAAPFNPMVFLQDYFQQLLSGGANIQVVIEGGPSGGIGNLGDYFIGPGLEQLIQQLAENDPNRYGTPPAAKSAITGLPDIKISVELLASDEAQCSVCMETFKLGDEAKQMPCKHIFHKDCILPWLELHNSCPVCRHELPTDDPDYEQRRGAPAALSARPTAGIRDPGSVGGSAGAFAEGGAPSPRTVERRFRISLPWPFRIFGAQAEGSDAAAGGNDGNAGGNGTDANSGRQGDGRSETRQEDLD
ncbi:E3 ubiquitin-protein ligase RING1-like [Musa acuminata AAA Group]|uniref:E3 ubiquitin-protein ligase RING1-like n=1 Tax=Musa acuminata AAA Group TaxID=214697 RepID=UPI0031D8EE33